jgi:predicted GIY-YIG superfamily endonuclease
MGDWSVYLLRCGDGSLYTGIATDVERRVREHTSGLRGAKYLRGRGPLTLVAQIEVDSQAEALRLEHRIKRLPRARKEALLGDPRQARRLLEKPADTTPASRDMTAVHPPPAPE